MPATVPCVPCCPTAQSVNVPGVEGIPGSNGLNGINAYTITTADFVIPAVNSTVTVSVVSTAWMVIGQIVVATGPATFRVTTITDGSTVVLTFLGYPGDLSPAVTISSGAGISPAGVLSILTTPLTVYGSGTAYSLTNSSALLALGTTTPSLTISAAGTYLLLARARIDFNGLGVTNGRVVTIKLRRTNNTAADLTNGSAAFSCPVNTTGTGTAGMVNLPPIVYATPNNNDVVELWGSVSVVDNAGNLHCVEASIVAVKLF